MSVAAINPSKALDLAKFIFALLDTTASIREWCWVIPRTMKSH